MIKNNHLSVVLSLVMTAALTFPQLASAGKLAVSSSAAAGATSDVASVSACSASCPSDLNLDGVVDEKDQYLLKGVWGKVPASGSKLYSVAVCAAAISGDKNVTDGADLGILLGDYGKCSSGAASSAPSATKAQ
jgi:hypothetical protein